MTSGRKTITIRDASESHYRPGSVVAVFALEDDPHNHLGVVPPSCHIHIDGVQAIHWNDLTANHAQQEGMTLEELQDLLREVYPTAEQWYVISYHLVSVSPSSSLSS